MAKLNKGISFEFNVDGRSCNTYCKDENSIIEFDFIGGETNPLLITFNVKQQVPNTSKIKTIKIYFDILLNFSGARLKTSPDESSNNEGIKLSEGDNKIEKTLLPDEQIVLYFSKLPDAGKMQIIF